MLRATSETLETIRNSTAIIKQTGAGRKPFWNLKISLESSVRSSILGDDDCKMTKSMIVENNRLSPKLKSLKTVTINSVLSHKICFVRSVLSLTSRTQNVYVATSITTLKSN